MTATPTDPRTTVSPTAAGPFEIRTASEQPFSSARSRTSRRAAMSMRLAILACAACCSLPLLVGVGLLTAGTAAAINQTLSGAAIALAVLAVLFLGWRQRRRIAERTAAGRSCGCDGGRAC
ncbi:hypothetical protein Ga0074812_12749 [Parafrankia irregularis]|uniref:Mercuric ion transport protein n=1 Tax=Parafrankia irregularis TaxID=795642 RepID=A0A0S4QWX7_9ACTN|nr:MULTISPECIES: hypothetical protein [Parafrankia]MBE3201556.1 hypothetical protein [Parafrankia sp. CH37]CUU59372.1 hypothetical protein Ga0074812_12749 [Parafrankia irregularis]